MNWLNDWYHEIVATVVGFVATGLTVLVRKVLTNERKIALLQQEISSRENRKDSQRAEDRQVWHELKEELKEIRRDVLHIYSKNDQ